MATFDPNNQPIFASTQDHLDIIDIRDDMLILKNNRVSLVIQTSAVNFALLSENEQDTRILAFAGLLNSINYPLQVIVRTKKIDISNYITYLEEYLKTPMSVGRKTAMTVYLKFVKNLIVKNEILDKKFYVVVTYSNMPIRPVKLSLGKKTKQTMSQIATELLLEQAKLNLYPKRDHLIRQLLKMGITSFQLEADSLKKLFFDVYNDSNLKS